jgi:hypothetical protein
MDTLVAERDEARERVKYMSDGGEAYRTEARKWAERERARAEAAEEKAARMTDERNDARYVVKAAEARVTQLEAALRQVERHAVYFGDETHPEVILDIARAALADKEGT